MNVLIFVMTLLMLLALMTYSRLDIYRSSQVFQSIFKYYMENDERGYFNIKAQPIYDSIKVKTKEGKPGGPKAEGSPRLGIQLLLDKAQRESKVNEWNQTRVLLKNLLNSLYEKQPFYREAMDKRYTMVDDLIQAITEAVDELPKEKKLKTAADLANLKLADPELNMLLYKILQGGSYRNINVPKEPEAKSLLAERVESEIDQDDQALSSEASEYKSIEGYYSLLDFVTSTSAPKIRVFLAPREVLEAVFPSPEIVDNILAERKQFYRQAVNGGDTKELSETFRQAFERYKEQNVSDESLNFTVTKTNPKNYE